MAAAIGTIVTTAFALMSLVGTTAGSWSLGEALFPDRAGAAVGPLSLGMLLVLVAVCVEGLRLVVSIYGERIWRGSPFQGAAFAAPLWLACTAYCILMPLLALAFMPLLPSGSHLLTVVAPAWAAVQIAAGLLPGIRWPGDEPATHATETVRAPSAPVLRAVPAQFEAPSTASVNDFLEFLARLSELPAGSTLPRKGRIGFNREIVISQAGLAALVGRSKQTVRRWLQELERGERITKRATGKDTCIFLQPHAPKPNGDARVLNGGAHN